MDKYNTFHPRPYYQLLRLDYLSVLLVLSLTAILHLHEIVWWKFLVSFWWIDALGTFPAYVVYYGFRKGERRSISRVYYYLYNFAHSFTTNSAVLFAWYVGHGGWEWAMLAAPIHICGDRALFGNTYKPPGLSFEPVRLAAYDRFLAEYQGAGEW